MGMRMLQSSFLVLALAPSIAGGQQVYKCVAGGEVAYQSAPCAEGQAMEKAWDHGHYQPPEEADLQRVRDLQQAARQREIRARGTGKVGRWSTSARETGTSTIGRCDEAKAHRDRELYRLGPWKKMKDLRAWDQRVADACKP